MEHLLILLVGGLIVLVRKLFFEGGLDKILGKLDSDLNQPSEELRRSTPPPISRPMTTSLSPEEERMRKFREALGLPPDISSPTSTAPFPGGLTPSQRARQERERIERKLAEKRRTLQQPIPPPVPALPREARNADDDAVSKYFELDTFNSLNAPTIQQEKIPDSAPITSPIIEADFFKTLEKREMIPVTPETRLSEIFGKGTDLRRLILAQEILGRPKSLQTA